MHSSKVYIEGETGIGMSSEQMYHIHVLIDGITESVRKDKILASNYKLL